MNRSKYGNKNISTIWYEKRRRFWKIYALLLAKPANPDLFILLVMNPELASMLTIYDKQVRVVRFSVIATNSAFRSPSCAFKSIHEPSYIVISHKSRLIYGGMECKKRRLHFFFSRFFFVVRKISHANHITLLTFLCDFEVANDLAAPKKKLKKSTHTRRQHNPLFMQTHNEYQQLRQTEYSTKDMQSHTVLDTHTHTRQQIHDDMCVMQRNQRWCEWKSKWSNESNSLKPLLCHGIDKS